MKFLFLLCCCLLFSCKEKNNTPLELDKKVAALKESRDLLYSKNNTEYVFQATYSLDNDSTFIDTINLVCTGEVLEWDTLKKQKGIKWESLCNKRFLESLTGIVEDNNELWIHPPRFYIYSILELSAFPYINFPLKIGKKWEWSIDVGDTWLKKVDIKGDKLTNFTHSYIVKNENMIASNFGNLNCYIINATTTSSLGISTSKFYYNHKYGFVEMTFNNINETILHFKLIKKNDTNLIRGTRLFNN